MRSYKIPLLRVLSLVLAVMTTVSLTAVPSLDLQVVQTAQAAPTAGTRPTITFSEESKDNWLNNDNTRAMVVTGSSGTINIREAVPKGLAYNPAKLVFESADDDAKLTLEADTLNNQQSTIAGGSVVIGAINNEDRTLTFKENFDPNEPNSGTGDPTNAASVTYRIHGVYQTSMSQGTATESGAPAKTVNILGKQGQGTDMVSITGENNTLKFTCVTPETATTSPVFRIDDGTGSFATYKDSGGFVQLFSTSTAKRNDLTKATERTLVFWVQNASGNRENWFQIRTDTIHDDHTTTDANGTTTQYYNNYIAKDTEFTLSFAVPNSAQPDISLTVVTPQAVMRDIEGEIENVKNEAHSKFINFARIPANGIDDDRNWVTTDFTVLSEMKRYRAPFRIEWKWEPLDSSNETAKNAVRAGVVDRGENERWQTMEVENPGKDAVVGDLVPYIYYTGGNTAQESSTPKAQLPRIRLNIPGQSGDYPAIKEVVQEVGRKSGNSSTETILLGGAEIVEKTMTKAMDAYRGEIEEWQPFNNYVGNPPPFRYQLKLEMGTENNAADYITITPSPNSNTDPVILKVDKSGSGGVFVEHDGQNIYPNRATGDNRAVQFQFEAQRIPYTYPLTGKSVTYTIQFWHTRRSDGRPTEIASSTKTITFNVTDTLPDPESRLKDLIVTDQNGKEIENLEYKFNPDTKEYDLSLPYRVEGIHLEPIFMRPQKSAFRDAYIVIRDRMGALAKNSKNYVSDSGRIPVAHDEQSELISFTDSGDIGRNSYKITVTAPSEDPREDEPDYRTTYTLNVYRNNASNVSTLNGLGIYPYAEENDSKDNETPENNYIKNFDPDTLSYDIIVPYSTDVLKFRWEKGYNWQKDPELLPPFKLETMGRFDTDPCKLKNIKRLFQDSGNLDDEGALVVEMEVVSELGDVTGNKEGHSTIYTIHIFRESPNHDATLAALSVYDKDKNEQRIIPTFNPSNRTYSAEVDFSVEQILLSIDPTYKKPGNIQVYFRTEEPGNLLLDMREGKDVTHFPDKGPLTFDIGTNEYTPKIPYFPVDLTRPEGQQYILDYTQTLPIGYEQFIIKVTPECEEAGGSDGRDHTQTYNLQIRRKEPSHEARLQSLQLKDQSNGPIKTFAFHQDEFNYSLTVPYETTGISFTPTVLEPHAKFVIVDGVEHKEGSTAYSGLESGATSKVFQLPEQHGVDRTYTVIVTAQDGVTQRRYNVTVRRAPPSSDAWLKALTTDHTENFKPLFVPKNMDYTAEVKMGEPGVTITATANHPAATIKIDGMVVESGVASDLISLLDVKQTVTIEVTAQDGVTKKYYHIEFTNMNLVELTNNADLKNLTVNYGLMTPKFQAAVTEYEVTVKEDTWSVDIIPRLSDDLASIRVLNGTRELGDYRGNYALALVDGENNVTVEVTSPDKTVVKNYDITVYRNDEEKLKNLEPLESEDINWENTTNPILVKIEEYPRVGASVFNTIREEYPEKSIIFQGNDYSIRFDGKNLNRVIPQREIFDFRMTFDSPDEDAIYDLIEEREANDDILDDVVLCYFDYHGSLPGPATFNLSLGRKYSNETLYWHYYNQERDRIDYYGSLKSNSKGTVAVSIDHFSTYVVSPTHRIAGSEDKDGVIDQLGMVSNGKDLLGSGGKLNPDTGETEDRP